MQKLLGKIGKVLFHRLGIVGVLILAQIVLYGVGLTVLWNSDSFGWVKWLFVALSVLSALWIVGSKSNPGYKIGWLIIVLGLMPFGSVAYLLLGGNHLSGFNQRRLRTMERKIRRNLGEECGRSASLGELMGEDAGCMARYLEQTTHCPVFGNTRTKYYPLGDDCYDDILEALRGAERYIFIEYFIIEEGKLWNSVLDIAREKAARGVEVRVIYDDIGSISTLPGDYPVRLEQMGIQCRVFNRFVPVVSLRQNNRDHRKYMIIDGRVAFTGGINMADEYINVKRRFGHWKDAAIRLEGDAVWSMTVSFLSMWDFTHSEEERFTPFRPAPARAGAVGLRPALPRLPLGQRGGGPVGVPPPDLPGQAVCIYHHPLPGDRLLADHGPHHRRQVGGGRADHHPPYPGQENRVRDDPLLLRGADRGGGTDL